MNDRHWVIYTLNDPRFPDDVRYVGVTHGKPEQRLARHISSARKRPRYHSLRWIKSLLDNGVRPLLKVIAEGSGPAWGDAEIFWISWHRERGHRLTNHAIGGRGPVGCVRSPETRAKLAANRGKKQTPELIERRIAPIRGRPQTEDAKAKIKAGMKGRKVSPDGRAAIAEARRANPEWNVRIARTNKETWERKKAEGLVSCGERKRPTPKTAKRLSDQTKLKMSETRTGKKQSPETKEKRREIMLRVWAARKAKSAEEKP